MYRLTRLTRRRHWWYRLLRQHLQSTSHTIERLGIGHGSWYVPTDMIQSDWIIYSFGIGTDISFDRDLISRYGCTVHGFDPTPRSIAYMKNDAEPPATFQFHPYGVWSENTTLRFYNPEQDDFASYSALNLRHQTDYVEAEVRTIPTLMQEQGHDRIDLMKMDIEGAEQVVIPHLLASDIRPLVLCVEYDQPNEMLSRLAWQCFKRGLDLNRALITAGYRMVKIDNWNVTYLFDD